MVTVVSLDMALVVMVKEAVVVPAATVTPVGTWAADVLLLDSATTAPEAGAGPLSVTVPVEELPLITDVGLTETPFNTAAVTVNEVLAVVPSVPEILSAVSLATALVAMVNVAVVAPAATVTLAGTCAAATLLLDNVTTAPPAGAGPVRVTVPVDEVPPITEGGLIFTELRLTAGAVTVRPAV
jgi:hypothetical protein